MSKNVRVPEGSVDVGLSGELVEMAREARPGNIVYTRLFVPIDGGVRLEIGDYSVSEERKRSRDAREFYSNEMVREARRYKKGRKNLREAGFTPREIQHKVMLAKMCSPEYTSLHKLEMGGGECDSTVEVSSGDETEEVEEKEGVPKVEEPLTLYPPLGKRGWTVLEGKKLEVGTDSEMKLRQNVYAEWWMWDYDLRESVPKGAVYRILTRPIKLLIESKNSTPIITQMYVVRVGGEEKGVMMTRGELMRRLNQLSTHVAWQQFMQEGAPNFWEYIRTCDYWMNNSATYN